MPPTNTAPSQFPSWLSAQPSPSLSKVPLHEPHERTAGMAAHWRPCARQCYQIARPLIPQCRKGLTRLAALSTTGFVRPSPMPKPLSKRECFPFGCQCFSCCLKRSFLPSGFVTSARCRWPDGLLPISRHRGDFRDVRARPRPSLRASGDSNPGDCWVY